jgi:PadR family transcriptional regulator PadR
VFVQAGLTGKIASFQNAGSGDRQVAASLQICETSRLNYIYIGRIIFVIEFRPLRRVTPATVDVLTALLDGDEPVWGMKVIKDSGRFAGTVYPILGRLESDGWVTSRWDDDESRPGPRRRYYELASRGLEEAKLLISTRPAKDSSDTSPLAGTHSRDSR